MDDRHLTDGDACFDGGHPCKLPILPKEILKFVREYFASVLVSRELLDEVVSFCEVSFQQQLLGDLLRSIPVRPKKFHLRKSHRNALKYIVEKLEARHAEVGWQLYICLTDSMMDNAAYIDRIYFNQTFSRYIIVQENRYQLSQGATGLSCWQASCDLANYLLKYGRDYITESNILELGAGCGLLGIALAASGLARSITLSDGNRDVLSTIRSNIRTNFSKDRDSMYNVIFLEWETVNVEDVPVVPDVIFAADVVYDSSAIKPLVCAIRKLLTAFTKGNNTGPCCVIANTIRNQDTVDKFVACAGENGLLVKSCFTYENSIFKLATGDVKDGSLFPFTSSVHCPTVFHKLILNG